MIGTREAGTADLRCASKWDGKPHRGAIERMQGNGHESGMKGAGGGRFLPWCWSVRLCTCVARRWLPPLAISRISQYITGGPRARLRPRAFYLALLLLPLRRYAGLRLRYRGNEARTRAKDAQRPNPQRIVHTVLIGIHCRGSNLCRGGHSRRGSASIRSDIWELPCP